MVTKKKVDMAQIVNAMEDGLFIIQASCIWFSASLRIK